MSFKQLIKKMNEEEYWGARRCGKEITANNSGLTYNMK